MITKQILKKDGTPYFNKEDKILVENKLEAGDKFVPNIDTPITREGEYKSYSIPVSVFTKTGDTKDNVFITLTQSQADQITKTVDANQQLWTAYEYTNEFGTFIGISCKPLKPAKKITDFLNPDGTIKE